MTYKELAEIAMKYVDKGYDYEALMYGDDLYDATDREKEICGELWSECREIGFKAFQEKIDKL